MQFDLDGFIVLRNILGEAEVDSLNDVLADDAAPYSGRPARMGEMPLRSRFLIRSATARRLIDHPAVLPYLEEWIEPEFRLDHVYALRTEPGKPQLPLHHGGAKALYFAAYQRIGGKIRAGSISVMWALVDMPAGSGTFTCLRGSHLAAFDCPDSIRNYEADWPGLVEIGLNKGDALVFTEALTHGARTWNAPYRRSLLLFKYAPGCMAWSNEVWPEDFVNTLSDRQRRICRPPWVEDVYSSGRRFRSAVENPDWYPIEGDKTVGG